MEKKPGAQSWQTEAPASEYVPNVVHKVHTDANEAALALEYVPATHIWQADAAFWLLKVPLWHEVQTEAAKYEYVPAIHDVHKLAWEERNVVEYFPAGHGMQI